MLTKVVWTWPKLTLKYNWTLLSSKYLYLKNYFVQICSSPRNNSPGLPWKYDLVRKKATASLNMDSRSNFDKIFCSNGSREAKWSNSPFNRSRWRFEGLLLAWLLLSFVGVGLKLENLKKMYKYSIFNEVKQKCSSLKQLKATWSNSKQLEATWSNLKQLKATRSNLKYLETTKKIQSNWKEVKSSNSK